MKTIMIQFLKRKRQRWTPINRIRSAHPRSKYNQAVRPSECGFCCKLRASQNYNVARVVLRAPFAMNATLKVIPTLELTVVKQSTATEIRIQTLPTFVLVMYVPSSTCIHHPEKFGLLSMIPHTS